MNRKFISIYSFTAFATLQIKLKLSHLKFETWFSLNFSLMYKWDFFFSLCFYCVWMVDWSFLFAGQSSGVLMMLIYSVNRSQPWIYQNKYFLGIHLILLFPSFSGWNRHWSCMLVTRSISCSDCVHDGCLFYQRANAAPVFLWLVLFVFLFFPFISHYIYTDPQHWNMTELWIKLLKDDLNEFTYPALLAGLEYDISSQRNAITVSKLSKIWRNLRIWVSQVLLGNVDVLKTGAFITTKHL